VGALSRPLVVTADPTLLDDLLRLCAAAGVECEVAADMGSARRGWARAPLVIIGDDAAWAFSGAGALAVEGGDGAGRRSGVVLLGTDPDDAGVWRRAVLVGAEQVVFLPEAESWLVDRFADTAEGASSATTICVVGGRGGAGASTLSAALAVTGMRRGMRVLLVDGDPLGGGLDLVLGGEDAVGLRWPELAAARGRVSGSALREALPRVDELTVLSWDRGDPLDISRSAMCSVLDAAGRGSDLVVIDLPRQLDEAAEEALTRSAVSLLVVPAEVRATAAAARVAGAVGLYADDLRVVVRGPAPSGLGADVVAASLALPLAGWLRPEPGLAGALERGEPPARRGKGPLAHFCGAFLAELHRRGDEGSAAA